MAFPFAAIPGIVGILGSIFGKKKGKKNQSTYSPMQDEMANMWRQRLMNMAGTRMGQPNQSQQIGNYLAAMMGQNYGFPNNWANPQMSNRMYGPTSAPPPTTNQRA